VLIIFIMISVQITVKLDLTNVEPAHDETSKRVNREQESMDAAILGYAQMDVLATNLVFGKWNVQAVNPTEVCKIMDSMRTEGIHQYRPENFFSMVVRAEDIDITKLSRRPTQARTSRTSLPCSKVKWKR
jgi:hypothetical protein